MKAARGAASLEELLEMLSAVGIDAEVKPVTESAELAPMIAALNRKGAQAHLMNARLKGGQPMLAFFVLPPV